MLRIEESGTQGLGNLGEYAQQVVSIGEFRVGRRKSVLWSLRWQAVGRSSYPGHLSVPLVEPTIVFKEPYKDASSSQCAPLGNSVI